MTTDERITLVTGGNSGLGLAIAAALMSVPNNRVLLGCRSVERGEAAVHDLEGRGHPGVVELLVLDVASDESITAAAKAVESRHGRLDALVNNAAIGWPSSSRAEAMAVAFRVNATGPLLMTEAFHSLLQSSTTVPRVINISSGGGLISRHSQRASTGNQLGLASLPYCASKAAMNLISLMHAVEFGGEPARVKIFVYSPGFVASNLGLHNTVENGAMPASEAAGPIVRILDGERDDDVGRFMRADGVYPW